MKNIFKRFENMERKAYMSIRIGLSAVIICSLVLLVYIDKSNSYKQLEMLKSSIPSLVMSALIVIGGGFAFDALLKERK